MPSGDVDIYTRIVRRSVFFHEDFGTIWRGNVIPGIAPISEVLPNTRDLEAAIPTSDPVLKKELLSRTFVLYNTKPEGLKARAAVLVQKTPFITRFICSHPDRQVLAHASVPDVLMLRTDSVLPKDVLLILYASGISEHPLQKQQHLLSSPRIRNSITDLLASRMSNVSFVHRSSPQENNILCIARYKPYEKPWLHKVLDSVFYMEQRELLTRQELILRYVATILLFPTIIAPLGCLVMALASKQRTKLSSSGLTRWQYSQHKKRLAALRSVPALFKDTSMRTERYRETLFQLLIARGYLDAAKEPTSLGKRTSDRHNLMLATTISLLTKKQLAARCLFWAAIALAFVSSIAHFVLTSATFGNETKAFTAFTVAAMGGILAAAVLAFHIRNRTVQHAAVGGLAFATIGLTTVYAIFSLSGQIPISPNKISALTAFIVVFAVATTCFAIAENFILYKNDRSAAEHLGLSLTAYLDVKPHVKAELGKCDEEYLKVTACLNALQDGGADIGPLLDNPMIGQLTDRREILTSRTA